MTIDAAHPVPPTLPRSAGPDQIPPHVPKDLVRSIGLTTGAVRTVTGFDLNSQIVDH